MQPVAIDPVQLPDDFLVGSAIQDAMCEAMEGGNGKPSEFAGQAVDTWITFIDSLEGTTEKLFADSITLAALYGKLETYRPA